MYLKVNNPTFSISCSPYCCSKAPFVSHGTAILKFDNLQTTSLLENSRRSRKPSPSLPGQPKRHGNSPLFPSENSHRAPVANPRSPRRQGSALLPPAQREEEQEVRRGDVWECGQRSIQRSRRPRPPRRQSATRVSKVPPPPPSPASPPELLLPFRHPGSTAIFLFLHQCPLFM